MEERDSFTSRVSQCWCIHAKPRVEETDAGFPIWLSRACLPLVRTTMAWDLHLPRAGSLVQGWAWEAS